MEDVFKKLEEAIKKIEEVMQETPESEIGKMRVLEKYHMVLTGKLCDYRWGVKCVREKYENIRRQFPFKQREEVDENLKRRGVDIAKILNF